MNDGMTRDSKALASIHAIAYGDCYQFLGFACLLVYNIYNIPCIPNVLEFVFLGLFEVVWPTERITWSY